MRVYKMSHVSLYCKNPIERVFETFEFATLASLSQWGESSNSNVWMSALSVVVGMRDASSIA